MLFKKYWSLCWGENDNNAIAGKLDQSAQAMRQGEHRLARGKRFFETAKSLAKDNDEGFNWQLNVVPNVGHQKSRMIKAAAELLCSNIKQK